MAREPSGAILNPAPGALTNLLRLISNNDAIVGLATHGSPILAYRPNGLIKPEPASRSVAELEAPRALLEAAPRKARLDQRRCFEAILKPWAKTVGPCGVALGGPLNPLTPCSMHVVPCPKAYEDGTWGQRNKPSRRCRA